MKISTTVLALVFLASSAAWAGDCKGNVCVGGYVVDKDNSVGVVTGFPDSNTARYKVGSYSYDAPVAELKSEVPEYKGLKAGKLVVDSDGSVGTASHVFEDGRVQYRVGTYDYVSGRVSPQVDSLDGIAKDTVVVDSDNSVGAALAVFADGRVQYQVGSYSYVSSRVVGEVASKGIVAAGKQVIDSDGSVGKALHVFADGRVQYQVGTYSYVSANVVGEVPMVNGIAPGNVVVDESNSVGRAKVAFQDGRVSYSVGSYDFVSSKLEPEVKDYDGLHAGVYVIDEGDSVGTVSYAFRDGRVSYQAGSYFYVSSKVGKEVPTHPDGYQKGVTYATEYWDIGSVLRFFENRKIQLQSIDGYTRVATVLYPAVDTVDGVKAEDVVVDSRSRDATVKKLFANGTIAVVLNNPENPADKDKLMSAKLFGFYLEADKNRLADLQAEEGRDWILVLADAIAKRDNIPAYVGTPVYGMSFALESRLPEVKKTLQALLAKEPGLIQSSELRKKVYDYLSGN